MKDTTAKLCKLSSKINSSNKEEFEILWYKYFSLCLKDFGFNKTSIKKLFRWGIHGHNWKALHKANTEYKNSTDEQLINHFKGEVGYISDRLSLDRLFRAHWLFNQIINVRD